MRQALADNRRAAIAGGVGVAILLVYLATRVLSGGGGAPPGASTPPVSTTAPVAGGPPGAAPTTTSPAAAGTPVYTSKDPFLPLVNLNAGSGSSGSGSSGSGASTGSGSSSTGSTGSGAGSSSSTTTTTGGGGASSAGAAPGGSTSPTAGQLFEVLDIFASGSTTQASVQVDGSEYTVSPQDTFAGNYFVVDLSVSTQCGDFTHGGVPFHACKGEKVLK